MSRWPSVAGVILAAGASSRMGRDKALLSWRGRTFLEAQISLLQLGTELVIVVGGANAEALKPIVYSSAAFFVQNPDPELGEFSSLRVGLQAVLNFGRDAAAIALVDRPPVTAETFGRLRAGFDEALRKGKWAAVPQFEGGHGHPIFVSREMIEVFLRAPAGSNAREVQHQHQDRIEYIPVQDANAVANINTPDDYARVTGDNPQE